jgi:endonuclease III
MASQKVAQTPKGVEAISFIRRRLKKAYPKATTELHWRNPFELLIATILSAQTTDKKVNEVTPILFARYPTPQALAQANPAEVETIVRPLGYFRQKTRTIINAAKTLVERFERRSAPHDGRDAPVAGRRAQNRCHRFGHGVWRSGRHRCGHPCPTRRPTVGFDGAKATRKD